MPNPVTHPSCRRCLIIHTETQYLGGAEKMLHYYLEGLVAAGVETTLAAIAGSQVWGGVPPQVRQLPLANAQQFSLMQLWRQAQTVARAHRQHPFQVAHAWMARAWELGSLLAWRSGLPTLGTLHDHPQAPFISPSRQKLMRASAQWGLKKIAVVSGAVHQACVAAGYPLHKLAVVHNGLDGGACESRPGDGDAFRRRLQLDGRPIVLFGGRASGAKGGDQLVRAMSHVIRRVPAQLVVLGDRPEYFTVVRRIAAESGVPSGVGHDGGWLDPEGLRQAHGAATVCAIPSVYPDPFNLMTLRAMLHERPVVGTCHGATPELVVDGVTGRIADPWDAEAFGTAIADVIADPATAAAMGAAGRVRAIAEFSLDRQLAGYAQLLGVPV